MIARRLVPLLFFFAAAAAPAAADEQADAAYVRGLRLEESLGDREGALAAYRSAASSTDPGRRAAALLRAAGVLRSLGRDGEAREALRAVLDDASLQGVPGTREAAEESLRSLGAPGPVPESQEVRDLRERIRASEEEALRLRRLLDESLKTSAEVEPLRGALQAKERELRDLREKRRDAERSARGGYGELTERERGERRREDADASRVLSAELARLGRELYRAGRFEDARRFLRDAVDQDPENAAARELLARVSAPADAREQIVRNILEIHAIEQEILADQVCAESSVLLEEGRRLLEAGDPAKALENLDAALARLGAHPSLVDRLEPVRGEAARLFDEAARRAGSPRRAPAPPAAAPEEDPRWQEAVRAVLERAGSAGEAGGAALRIFPLGPALHAQRESLPPSPGGGTPPRGFVLSAEVPPPGPLLQAAIRGAVEPAAWRAPGAVLEGVGTVLVARSGTKALEAVERAVAGLAAPPARSILVRAVAFPCDAAVLVEALAKEGRALAALPRGGGAVAVLDAAAADRVEAALGGAAAAPADASFRVPERRGFRVAAHRPRPGAAAEEATAGLRLGGLAWFLPDGEVAAGVTVEIAVPGPRGAAEALGASVLVRQEAAAGATLPPGGALLFAGLVDPLASEPGRQGHLALLVRFGEDPSAPSHPEPSPQDAVLPLGDLPSREADAAGPLSAEGRDPRTARAEAIRAWLARRAAVGAEFRLDGTAVRVSGSSAAAEVAAGDLERLKQGGPAGKVEVRAYALDGRNEASLLRGLALRSAGPLAVSRYVLLRGDDRKRNLFLLEGIGGRIALSGEDVPALAAGRRAAFARAEGAGSQVAGLEVGVRAWPEDVPGERSLWIDLAWRRAADEAPAREPEARVSLPPGTAVLLVGLPNPFADAAGRGRVAVWVEAE